jgi:hypothetical protein
MPSVIGPTNYPIIEAIKSKTPILISDSHFLDIELSENLIANKFDSKEWASKIINILDNPDQLTLELRKLSLDQLEEKLYKEFEVKINEIVLRVTQIKKWK